MRCTDYGDECLDPEACLQGMFTCAIVKEMNVPRPEDASQLDPFDAEGELIRWWRRVASEDANAVIPKAVEYGSADFDIMGVALLVLVGDKWAEADPGEKTKIAAEMAIMFYILGKVGRALSAYAAGRFPSDDTLADLVRYGMMARHVREFGRWV